MLHTLWVQCRLPQYYANVVNGCRVGGCAVVYGILDGYAAERLASHSVYVGGWQDYTSLEILSATKKSTFICPFKFKLSATFTMNYFCLKFLWKKMRKNLLDSLFITFGLYHLHFSILLIVNIYFTQRCKKVAEYNHRGEGELPQKLNRLMGKFFLQTYNPLHKTLIDAFLSPSRLFDAVLSPPSYWEQWSIINIMENVCVGGIGAHTVLLAYRCNERRRL